MKQNRSRAYYRFQSKTHSRRKRNLARKIYGGDWYRNEHQYSKNKIHCSCCLCRFYGPSYSDMKKTEKDKYSLQSFAEGDMEDEEHKCQVSVTR